MSEDKLDQIKERNDIAELENLPETIEDLEKNPILKPLLEFHKQASMLIKEDKLEHEFLVKIKDEVDKDLATGIYDNSNIVKKFVGLIREYDRLILIYSRYTDLADDKILEMKKIVEKYYITRKSYQSQISAIQKEVERIREEKIIKEQKRPKQELKEYESDFLDNEPPEVEEDEFEEEKSVEKEDEEESMEEYLNRKVPRG